MDTLLDLLKYDSVCSQFFLAMLFYPMGSWLVQESPRLKQWGYRAAAVAFVAYIVFGTIVFEPRGADDVVPIVIRAFVVFFLSIGTSWIGLTFLGRAYDYSLGILFERVRRVYQRHQRHIDNAARDRDAERERLRQQELAREKASEQDSKQSAADQQKLAVTHAQRRRRDARARAHALYLRLRPQLADRFPRKLYDQFVAEHLTDEHTPEELEANVAILEEVLSNHADPAASKSEEEDFLGLIAWYERTDGEIEANVKDERMRKSLKAILKSQYNQLLTRYFQEHQP